jgi:fibro-slime domain-containing protein
MKFLPASRSNAPGSPTPGSRAPNSAARLSFRWSGVGASLLSVLALAFLARCGAQGDNATIDVGPGGDGLPPLIDPGGSGGGIIGNCTDAVCMLEGGGTIEIPPGCGDGVLTPDEACDDGNRNAGDGCAEHCLATEPGFSCAAPGQQCRQIARCGDGLVAATEQCDDGNIDPGDGCTGRCRVELGKQCSGQPSVCIDAICGNNQKEGAEACDDGNTTPFDGCSSICLREPNCSGPSCVSECGDGLLINEECDDGNLVDGDGCSSTCTRETGFNCVANAACEQDPVNGGCVLRVPAIFRDFGAHEDFGNNGACTDMIPGMVNQTLDADKRPTMSAQVNTGAACLSNPQNFLQWYQSLPGVNQTLIGNITLYDNEQGGYVNRFGPNGEQFLGIQAGAAERGYVPTLAQCQQVCANEAANETQCFNECNPFTQDVQQTQNDLNQRTQQLNQAIAQNNAAQIPVLQAQVDQLTLDLAEAQAGLATCQTNCQAETTRITDACSATCAPCRTNPQQFCSGGTPVYLDGNPLFFPVDSITGPTSITPAPATASVPDQYGWNGFPDESQLFPGRPPASYVHNFYFTTEVQYWFKYEADTQATLTFLGDDDVWVFLNGRLAVDLGGVHVPSTGTLTINAAQGQVNATMQDGRGFPTYTRPAINRPGTTQQFGLVPGNVYLITIFHAERQVDGYSFQLTLAGFEATPSECTAICGDNVLSFGEECDDGVNDGGYGECDANCKLGGFCGDKIVQADGGESCDVGPIGDATCRGCRAVQIK